MESWQLSPRYFETMHHLIQRGIVLINLNLRSLFHFIPLSMYVLSLSSRDTQRRIPLVDRELLDL